MENVHKLFSKPKYYFIFPIVVAALFSTSLIQVACPVCGGAGVLSQSVGMQDVRVVSVDSRVLDSVQDACTNYIVTSADPIIRRHRDCQRLPRAAPHRQQNRSDPRNSGPSY